MAMLLRAELQLRILIKYGPHTFYPHAFAFRKLLTGLTSKGFKPTSGDLRALNFHSSPRVWAYFSVDNYGSVHEFADSQFGHVFAWGPSRNEARQAMILALKVVFV